jgi:hypothetical protein
MHPPDDSLIAVIVSAIVAMLASVVGALMPALQEASVAAQDLIKSITIMDDARMRLVCLAGSIGGALLAVGVFWKEGQKVRPLIIKLFCSVLVGVLFAPYLARKSGVSLDTDSLLFISGIVGVSGLSTLQLILPFLPEIWAKTFGKWFGLGKITTDDYDVSGHRSTAEKHHKRTVKTEKIPKLSSPPPGEDEGDD